MNALKQKRLERLKGTVAEFTPDPELDAAYAHHVSEMEYWGWPIEPRDEWEKKHRELYSPKPSPKP